MKRIDREKAQAEIDEIKKERKKKRRITADAYADLIPIAAHIFAWARANSCSKRDLQDAVVRHCNVRVSRDRLYRFVCRELGCWPNGKTK